MTKNQQPIIHNRATATYVSSRDIAVHFDKAHNHILHVYRRAREVAPLFFA